MAHVLLGEKRQGVSSVRSLGGVPILDDTYHWIVRADSTTASRTSILATTGVPRVGVTITADSAAVCRTVSATRREDQILLWDVTATFSSEVDERQGTQAITGDPTSWLPVYETKFERLQEITTRDYAGDAVVNSAGQPFENGILRSRFIPIWEFFQIEASSVTDEQVLERNEVVNNATFKGRAADTLLCTVLSSVLGFYYGARRRLTKYSLRYNEKKWTHKRLDVGTVYLDGGAHKAYLDDDGNVILGGLNGSGAKVTPGADPALLEFDMYPSATFSSFLRI
jgi:hypothetical protein